ncbi:MAG TPA: acyltransferase [Marmoricola sp.]
MTLRADAPTSGVDHPARIGHLDGIRALAILSVVVFHWSGGVFMGGYIGVDVFLTLSGYLITTLLIRRREQSLAHGYAVFMRARVRRLYPAMLGLVLGVLVLTSVVPGEPFDLLRPSVGSYAVTLFQVSWIPVVDNWGPHAQVFIHSWSLAVEWTFYAVWPWLVWRVVAGRRRPWLDVAVASVVLWLVCAAFLPWQWFYASPLARAAQLGAGCALALYVVPRGGGGVFMRLSRLKAEALFMASFLVVVGWTLLGPDAGETYRWAAFAVVPLATIGMIASGFRSVVADRLTRLPMVRAVGVASYSIYLWHVPWMLMIDHDALGIPRPAAAVCLIAMTGLTAAASYWLLERPYFRARPPRRVSTPQPDPA